MHNIKYNIVNRHCTEPYAKRSKLYSELQTKRTIQRWGTITKCGLFVSGSLCIAYMLAHLIAYINHII